MARKGTGTRNELIRCDSCGEEYSVTYRRCPFCGGKGRQNASKEDTFVFEGGYIFDEIDREKAAGDGRSGDTGRDAGRNTASRGGRRATGTATTATSARSGSTTRGGSTRRGRPPEDEEPEPEWVIALQEFWDRTGLTPARLLVLLGTLAVIIAAFVIVVRLILPDDGGEDPQGSGSPDPGHSQTGDPGGSDPGTSDPGTSDPGTSDPGTSDPGSSDDPDPTPTGSQPTVTFTLDKSEFTISDRWPAPVRINAAFDPPAAAETITWTSSDPSVATVDQTGLVTAVARGSTTITATLPSGAARTCKVYVTISDGSDDPGDEPDPSGDPSPSPSLSNTLTLDRSEFTISDRWPDPVRLRAEGGVGAVTWTSSDPSVATVDANGTVTRVGEGRCTITATDEEGNTASCIVRCNYG